MSTSAPCRIAGEDPALAKLRRTDHSEDLRLLTRLRPPTRAIVSLLHGIPSPKGACHWQYGPERRLLDGRHGLCDHVRAVDELFWVVADDSELRHTWPMESWSSSALVVHHALPPACRVRVTRQRNVRPEAHLVVLRQPRVDLQAACCPRCSRRTGRRHPSATPRGRSAFRT